MCSILGWCLHDWSTSCLQQQLTHLCLGSPFSLLYSPPGIPLCTFLIHMTLSWPLLSGETRLSQGSLKLLPSGFAWQQCACGWLRWLKWGQASEYGLDVSQLASFYSTIRFPSWGYVPSRKDHSLPNCLRDFCFLPSPSTVRLSPHESLQICS